VTNNARNFDVYVKGRHCNGLIVTLNLSYNRGEGRGAQRRPVLTRIRTNEGETIMTNTAAADRIWLSSYPPNTPADIAPLGHDSIAGLDRGSVQAIRRAAGVYLHGERPSPMRRWSAFRRLSAPGCNRWAWEKGDRVALMMPNILQMPVAMAAVLRAGYTVVNVNPLYTPRELEHQLKDSGAKAISFSRTSRSRCSR
jgi:hypothetical protein